jgi:antitoxin component of MazEF toxin-antitoxin module
MLRKIIKVGTSAAVVIPKTELKKHGMKIGEEINVLISKKNDYIDPEIIVHVDKLIKRYRPMLEKLARS